MRDYLVVFGVALATVVIATPVSRRIAVAVGAVDHPGQRRIHTRPTPRLGGVALFVGILAALLAGSRLPEFADVFAATSEPEALVLASVVIVVVGLLDDVVDVPAPVKLAGQIMAAGVLVLFGVVLRFVYLPGDPGTLVYLSPDLGAVFTIAAIVVMVNAVNLTDGLDGLAAGMVAIAAAALLAWVHLAEATRLDEPTAAALLLTALVGACLGFLFFNFHPASVFMGDTGAMLLGLLLGAAGISSLGPILTPSRSDLAAASIPVLIPALVLAVPMLDVAWTILRRLISGDGLFSPDKRHLHHRLVAIGHSQRGAVLVMYYWSALLAFTAVGTSFLEVPAVLAVLALGAVPVASITLWARLRPDRELVQDFTNLSPGNSENASDQGK